MYSIGLLLFACVCFFFFLLIFSIYYCSRQLLWKCSTDSLVTASAPPLANTWKFILRASWTTSFSLGGKLLSLPMSQGKYTHMHVNRGMRRALERSGDQFLRGPGNSLPVQRGQWHPTSQQQPNPSARWALVHLFPFVSRTGDTITITVSYLSVAEAHGVKKNWKGLSS